MSIDKLITKDELKETMTLLNTIKERNDKRDYAICRRMVLTAANIHSLNNIQPYSWFLERLRKWVKSNQNIDSLMSIKMRAKYHMDYYKMNSNTILYSEYGKFMNELIDTKNEQLECDRKNKEIILPW